MEARVGCLALLGLWAVLGVYVQMTGGFEDEAGRFACMGLHGVAVVVVGVAIESATTRERHAQERTNGRADFSPSLNPLDYATPLRAPARQQPDRGSLPALLAGSGIAALLFASIMHSASEMSTVSAVIEAGLIVLGILLVAFAAVLALRRRG